MDSQETRKLIDDIYTSISISHAWIVYDGERDNSQQVMSLTDWLRAENYPLCVITKSNASCIDLLEHSYRMFLVDKNDIHVVLEAKHNDLSNVSVILCTSTEVMKDVSKQVVNYDDKNIICMC